MLASCLATPAWAFMAEVGGEEEGEGEEGKEQGGGEGGRLGEWGEGFV